jgi:hypothetical protein
VGSRKPQRDAGVGQQLGPYDGVPVQRQIVLGGLGEFRSGGCFFAFVRTGFRASVAAARALVAGEIAFMDLDFAGLTNFDKGPAPVLRQSLDMLPHGKPLALLQHRHAPAFFGQFIPEPRDCRILQGPEGIAVREIADLAEQVADDLALVVIKRKPCGGGCDLAGAEQPLLQPEAARRAFRFLLIVSVRLPLKRGNPFLLLVSCGCGQ